MKINNPVKFTAGKNANSADNALASIGDVKKICGDSKNFSIFSQQFSVNGNDENGWHNERTLDDNFVRYSFNGGASWQIESSYQGDTFILIKDNSKLIDFPTNNIDNVNVLSFMLTDDNSTLGAILSSLIENNEENIIPSFTLNNGNITYDFFSTRNYR